MRKILIAGIILILFAVSAVAYEKYNTMYFDTGTAKVQRQQFVGLADTFEVTLDEELPTIDYHVAIENTESLFQYYGIEGIKVKKICFVKEKTAASFRGECNYIASYVFGGSNIGIFVSIPDLTAELKKQYQDTYIISETQNINDINWLLMAKHQKTLLFIGQ